MRISPSSGSSFASSSSCRPNDVWRAGQEHQRSADPDDVGGPRASGILTSAIDRADRQHRRDDPGHQEAVIRELYSGWINRLAHLEQENRQSNSGAARTFREMATSTGPTERDVALEAYRR